MMKKTENLVSHLLVLSLLLLSNSSLAAVNMKNASFRSFAQDLSFLERTYNSRSLYFGRFGFGWCSNIETRLILHKNRKIEVEQCDAKIEFTAHQKSKDRYFSAGNPDGKLIQTQKQFTYIDSQGVERVFNLRGDLIQVSKDGNVLMTLIHENHKPVQVRVGDGTQWNVIYRSDDKKVEKLKSSHGREVRFVYDLENLVKVTDDSKTRFQYQYDDLHNLTHIREESKPDQRIRYDPDHDRVLEYQRPDGCIENFTYAMSSQHQGFKETSVARIRCPKSSLVAHQETYQITYEFWYAPHASGSLLLTKVQSFIKSTKGG